MSAQSATATINVLDASLLVPGTTTLTVGGKVYTFVSGVPVGDQIQIAATDPLTAANIAIRVSTDTATTLCTASAALDVVTLTANTAGTAGNSIVLSETAIPTALTVVAFAGGADNTDYATVAELKPLVGITTSETADTVRLQRLLNTAARLFDQHTRGPYVMEGQEAYIQSASSTRYYDDLMTSSYLDVHDLLSVTEIVRGSTTVTTPYYMLLPRNPGNGPYTSIQFSTGLSISRDTEDHISYSTLGFVTGGIAITGRWGYCTAANRPDAVKEATLALAAVFYKTGSLSMDQVLNMISNNDPIGILARNVRDIVNAFKRRTRVMVA